MSLFRGQRDLPPKAIADIEPDDGPLPIGATVLHLPAVEPSMTLAAHLLRCGASDRAVDAAGGPGAADALRARS